LPIGAEPDPQKAARADVICTVTGARDPILFGDWVRPGAHINVVGSSHPGPVEVDHALVMASRYFADSRRSVLAAGAEFLDAKAAGLIGDDHLVAEIGEVLLGRVSGRTAPDQITLYKSLGHIVQDLAAAAYIDAANARLR
jgi:ornithine cyclodeaminase